MFILSLLLAQTPDSGVERREFWSAPTLFFALMGLCALLIVGGVLVERLPEREEKESDEDGGDEGMAKADRRQAKQEAKARKKQERLDKKKEKAAKKQDAKGKKKGKKKKGKGSKAEVAAVATAGLATGEDDEPSEGVETGDSEGLADLGDLGDTESEATEEAGDESPAESMFEIPEAEAEPDTGGLPDFTLDGDDKSDDEEEFPDFKFE